MREGALRGSGSWDFGNVSTWAKFVIFIFTCTKSEGPELESPFLSSSPILLILYS